MTDAREWLDQQPLSAKKMRDALLGVLDLIETSKWLKAEGDFWFGEWVAGRDYTLDRPIGYSLRQSDIKALESIINSALGLTNEQPE